MCAWDFSENSLVLAARYPEGSAPFKGEMQWPLIRRSQSLPSHAILQPSVRFGASSKPCFRSLLSDAQLEELCGSSRPIDAHAPADSVREDAPLKRSVAQPASCVAPSDSPAEEEIHAGSVWSHKRRALVRNRISTIPRVQGEAILFDGCGSTQLNLGKVPSPGTLKLHFKTSASAEYLGLLRLYSQVVGPVSSAGAAGVQEDGRICAWDGNSWVGLSSVAAIRPDSWVCLIFVWAFGKLTLYIDGVRQSQIECGSTGGTLNVRPSGRLHVSWSERLLVQA